MNGLGDYLDALRPPRERGAFGGSLGAPPIGTPGIYDPEMWRFDGRWAPPRGATAPGMRPRMDPSAEFLRSGPKAYWQPATICVRVAQVGQGFISQPWSVTGAAGCTNVAGVRQGPKCPWGIWRLPTCTPESIAFAWQGPRYLWAQQKMKEMLAQPPTRETAAQWVWDAYALVSLLHWATNVRFGNPQANTFDYAVELERAGCIYPGLDVGSRAQARAQLMPRGAGFQAKLSLMLANWNRIQEAPFSPVEPEALRGDGVRPPLVPLSQGDFAPWWPQSAGYSTGPETVRDWAVTQGYQGADPAVAAAAFKTFMQESWGQDWRVDHMPAPAPGRAAFDVRVPLAGTYLSETRKMLEHYVNVPFLKWQTTILNVYATEMGPAVARLTGAERLAFNQSVADFAGRAAQVQASRWNQGEVVAYTQGAMILVATLVSAPAGALLGIMFALMNVFVHFLGDAGLLASGSSVCPAFPFLRVPDPPCDALAAPVDAVGLPIDPPPGPITLTRAQVDALQARRRSGVLTPTQQRLVERLVEQRLMPTPTPAPPPPPPPAPKSGGGGLVMGAAAVGLLALLLRRR